MRKAQQIQMRSKRLGMLAVIFISIASILSCKKETENTSDFSNKLQLGETVNISQPGWPVVNEKYSFADGSLIAFRLETKDDFGNSDFKLVVKSGGTVVSEYPFPSLQDYGHLYVSSFSAPEIGSYTIEAYVTTGNKLIDTKTLTITP